MKPYWIVLLTGLAACSGAAEIPDTPDLAELRAQYDRPNAELLDSAAAEDALSQLPPLDDLAAAMRAAGYVTNGVNASADSTKQDSDGRLRVQGSLRVNLRCPGAEPARNFDPSINGSVSMIVAVRESRIARSVGGQADRCIVRAELRNTSVPVVVDGPLAFDLGGDIGLRQRWSGVLLMKIDGSIQIGEHEFSGLSARFTDESFEYLLELADETYLVAQLDPGGITLRGDSTWTCPRGQPCALP